MSLLHNDTEFSDDAPPVRKPSRIGSALLAIALGIAIAAVLVIGWSGGFRP